MSDSAPTARIIAPAGTRAALIAIAIGLVLLGLLFHAECTAAVGVWIESTAYNHGCGSPGTGARGSPPARSARRR